MKHRKTLIAALAASILLGGTATSCIGSFRLSNKLLAWNRTISNKFVNELVFVAFWILPVYEVSGLADILVLNTIEFWSGTNPVAQGPRAVDGHDGRYMVECDGHGYTVTGPDGSVTRMDYDIDTRSWSIPTTHGPVVFLQFVDDTHVRVPNGQGGMMTVETSQQGLYAYTNAVNQLQLAQR